MSHMIYLNTLDGKEIAKLWKSSPIDSGVAKYVVFTRRGWRDDKQFEFTEIEKGDILSLADKYFSKRLYPFCVVVSIKEVTKKYSNRVMQKIRVKFFPDLLSVIEYSEKLRGKASGK